MRAHFSEASLTDAHILILREICQVASENYIFTCFLPVLMIEVAYLTAEAFCFRRLSVASFTENGKSTTNRRDFEAIMNCSAQVY